MNDLLTAPAKTTSSLKNRLYVMMFLQYFVQGSYLPVITEYLKSALGFTPDQIGYFVAALSIGPLAAPFLVGQLVDRHMATQHVLAICHAVGGLIMLSLFWMTDYGAIMVLGTIYSVLYFPSMMLTNSLTFHHLKAPDREFPMIRLWGTIGFIVPAWTIEPFFLADLRGTELDTARGIVLVFAGVSGLVMGLYCLTLPHTPPERRTKDFAPGKVVALLLKKRDFLVLVLVSLVVALVHQYHVLWNSPYLAALLEREGVASTSIQRISSIGQIFEVVVMAVLGLLLTRLGFKRTMLIGATAYFLRCVIFAYAVTLEGQLIVPMGLVCFGQALHGVCFGCFLAVAYMYVDHVASSDLRGSMQTFYGTFVVGLGFVAGPLVAGWMGTLFETAVGTATLRASLGIVSEAGIVSFERATGDVVQQLACDWTGIWLAGAAIALVPLIGFALFFPKQRTTPENEEA